ncbi:MAG: hypothetical protein R2774_13590 [Saprospiraceae bacterium]
MANIIISQDSLRVFTKDNVYGFSVGFGTQIPGGDMADRYGSTLGFSWSLDYMSSSNWCFSPEFLYFFGENIKEDVLAPYRSSNGTIPGDDAQIADIFSRERGLWLGLMAGKHFPFTHKSRSGLKCMIGGGIFQHKIDFNDLRNSVGQVRAGRYVGYDRLTRGFSLKETVSFKYMSGSKKLNLEFALDAVQGFTSEVRAINFDTGLPTNKGRLDLLVGARIIWNISFFYSKNTQTIYY